MPEHSSLTAIILCKNGERTLKTCLESLLFCDAIIVGDDGSIDDSIAIAKKAKADVIKLTPGLNFAEKRNFLLPYVQSQWILFIDVDEIITPALATEIRQTLDSGTQISGFLVKRSDTLMGRALKHGETSAVKLLRLARTGSGKWRRSVHEVWDVAGEIGELHHELLHFSHPNLEEFFEKIDIYTELEANSRIKNQESRIKSNSLRIASYFQLLVFPIAKFILNYIVRGGFLDGYPGFIMAWMMSFHSLCVRIKMLERLQMK